VLWNHIFFEDEMPSVSMFKKSHVHREFLHFAVHHCEWYCEFTFLHIWIHTKINKHLNCQYFTSKT